MINVHHSQASIQYPACSWWFSDSFTGLQISWRRTTPRRKPQRLRLEGTLRRRKGLWKSGKIFRLQIQYVQVEMDRLTQDQIEECNLTVNLGCRVQFCARSPSCVRSPGDRIRIPFCSFSRHSLFSLCPHRALLGDVCNCACWRLHHISKRLWGYSY